MSVWTHVAATFRVDCVRVRGGAVPNFEAIFGKTLNFDDEEEKWNEAYNNPGMYLPLGSEGSLKMSVWEDPHQSMLAAFTVSVFGDLRDYSDIKAIKEWFDRCCKNTWIRQAVITAECEVGESFTGKWCVDKEETIVFKEGDTT